MFAALQTCARSAHALRIFYGLPCLAHWTVDDCEWRAGGCGSPTPGPESPLRFQLNDEHCQRTRCVGKYLSYGALTTAALRLGFKVRQFPGSPHFHRNLSPRCRMAFEAACVRCRSCRGSWKAQIVPVLLAISSFRPSIRPDAHGIPKSRGSRLGLVSSFRLLRCVTANDMPTNVLLSS
jgi:hypothetical protein